MLAQWMTTNLRPIDAASANGTTPTPVISGGEGYELTFDLEVVRDLYESYKAADYWHTLEEPPPETDIHFVRYVCTHVCVCMCACARFLCLCFVCVCVFLTAQ